MADIRDALPYLKARIESDGPSVQLSEDDSPVLRPFVGQLMVAYVIDRGDNFLYVAGRDLREAGLTADELHALALENLTRFADERGVEMHELTDYVAVIFGGNFEATLMVLPWFCQHLRATYGDPIIVAAPARDILAIARGTRGIAELHAVIDRGGPDPDHPLTRDLYELDDHGWRVRKSN